MSGELVPQVLFGCDGCCFVVFAVSVDYAACFVSLTTQDLLLGLWSPLPTTVPWVHGQPSSY